MKQHIFTAILALVFGFVGAGIWSLSGLGQERTREYLIANPDILPAMAQAYQAEESASRLAEVSQDVTAPFPGAVLGNPNGSRTLVKFSDYACGFCKSSRPDVERLISEDPDLRVVIREWPIFEGSDYAAAMALAAAEQGKYEAFHDALFDFDRPSPDNIDRAAAAAQLDMDRAQRVASSPEVATELAQNAAMAQQLGFTGTPSWVTGSRAFEGAVGYGSLKEAMQGDSEG